MHTDHRRVPRAVSRRRFLAIGAAVASAAALAACGDEATAPTTTAPASGAVTAQPTSGPAATSPATSPAGATAGATTGATTGATMAAAPVAAAGKGKTLKMARNAEPQSPLVPWQVDDNPALFISVNIYDSLLRPTKDGMGVEPALATKWEASTDGLVWTFTLRDGLKFSDGTPVKGADVVASLQLCTTSKKSSWTDNYKAIKEIVAPDDKTIKVTLKQPHAPLLSELAMFCAATLPADFAKQSEMDGFDPTKTKGTGAYYLDGWK